VLKHHAAKEETELQLKLHPFLMYDLLVAWRWRWR